MSRNTTSILLASLVALVACRGEFEALEDTGESDTEAALVGIENRFRREGGAGAVRSGATLLQGIVYCSRCDRQMGVRYEGRQGRPYYLCCRQTSTGERVYCMSVPAERIDRWLEEKVLEAIEPVGIEAALDAVAELEKRGEDLKRQWEHRIEQAEYEAGLARRRYDAVDPDNRLVATNLERDWEEKLRVVEQVRKEYGERAAELE